MRVSVRRSDSGYVDFSHRVKVIFNGEELRHCITADEELNYVLCYALNDEGDFFVEEGLDTPKVIELYGEVQIIIPKECVSLLPRLAK